MGDVTTHQLPVHTVGHHRQRVFAQSSKLQDVLYDIRGPVHAARRAAGGRGPPHHQAQHRQPGAVRLRGARRDRAGHDPTCRTPQGYSDSQGILSARARGGHPLRAGQSASPASTSTTSTSATACSELITMTLQALLDNGDEVLIPAPDYPLWTASTALAGGTPVHYLCDEPPTGCPTSTTSRRKITPRTKAIVVINPNNPTGALYRRELLRADRRAGAPARPDRASPTRSTTRSSTTAPSTPRSPRSPTTCCS